MILVDLNQLIMSNFHQYMKAGIVSSSSTIMKNPKAPKRTSNLDDGPKFKDDISLLRHMILNSLRYYSAKYKTEYGKLVLCCDSKRYWRKDVFPFYKAKRATTRAASDYNWKVLFDHFDTIRDEMKANGPYKVIDVSGAEADDIIAVLCKYTGDNPIARGDNDSMWSSPEPEQVLIISADRDFLQLHKYSHVTQYDPLHKRTLHTKDPALFLREHIINGDRGDGIPNFLSSDDSFVAGKKQKSIMKKKLEGWLQVADIKDFCTTDYLLRNYRRNEQLIDLSQIPEDLADNIISEFENAKTTPRGQFLAFLISKGMKDLANSIGDF